MMASRCLVLVLAFLLLALEAPGQRSLKPTQRRKVDRALAKMKGATEAERDRLLREIAVFGAPLHGYLLKIADKDPSRGEVFTAMRRLDWIEGKDLETRDVGGAAPPWSLWSVGLGEVVMLRGLKRWTALRIEESYDPVAGKLTVTLAETESQVLSMGGPGVKRETRVLTGVEVVLEGRASAFPTRDFTTKVMGSDVVIRSVGSAAFRFSLKAGSRPVARTGQTNLKRVRAGMKGLVYHDRPRTDIAANCRRTQQYLFRLVDGMEPLPTYGTEDEDKFAHAEQVVVELRQERSGGNVLLVSFPHADETVPYDPPTHALLLAFAKRVFDVEENDTLVWIGKNEAHEANWFYNKGKWKRAAPRLRKRVRELFPEDY